MTDRPAPDTRTDGPAVVGTKPGDLQPAEVRIPTSPSASTSAVSGIKGAVVDVRTGQLVGDRFAHSDAPALGAA